MKKQHAEKHAVSRREFLQGAVAAGAGVALGAALPGAVAATPDQQQQQPATLPTTGKGYQASSHVRRYYETLKS